jgi:hypothetical protein
MPVALHTAPTAYTAPTYHTSPTHHHTYHSASSPTTPLPGAPASRMPAVPRPTHHERVQRRMGRRMTTSDVMPPSAAPLDRRGPSERVSRDMPDAESGPYIPSRRASWIRRLSLRSNSQHSQSSQPSTRNPSPVPMSPAVSYSTASAATYSYAGSTAPITGRRHPSMPPNKLVKRSSSTRVPYETPVQSPTLLRPSFRRPATSHQRSATLQHQAALSHFAAETPSTGIKPSSASTDSETEYTQFFTAKTIKQRTLSKRLHSSAGARRLRRIFPDEKYRPTLVMARAVSAGADGMEESASEAGESVFCVSRPGTPLSFTAAMPQAPNLNANVTGNAPPCTHTCIRSSTEYPRDDEVRRQSFSITEFLSNSTVRRRRTASTPDALANCSTHCANCHSRTRSDPLLLQTMAKRTAAAQGDLGERRILTDPTPTPMPMATPHPRHETAAEAAQSAQSRDPPNGLFGASWGAALALAHGAPVPVPDSRLASMPQLEGIASAARAANQGLPSPTSLAQAGVRPSRHSTAASEHASTLVGSSDNDARGLGSGDEDDADFRSETLYDSVPTAAAKSSSSGPRGPRIETIFDESPPAKVRVTALRDLLPPGAFREHILDTPARHHSIAEDDESTTTPVRTVRPDHYMHMQDSPSLARAPSAPLFPARLPTSPPGMPKPLSLGTLEWDSTVGDDDGSARWSLGDHALDELWVDLPPVGKGPSALSRHSHPRLLPSAPISKPAIPQRHSLEHCDRDTRSSIFDWSEQQLASKSSGNRTPPRPRTVHGKKDATDGRGSRSVGRRVPSGLHARSQSVPVVPDLVGKRSTVVTNKFGTWGVGSKGVTEDWNDDFDFSDLVEESTPQNPGGSHRIDSGSAMVVPKTIQEQQNNVLANISLLREWGMLIEELKEHRARAQSLNVIEGARSGMWEEVDAMIDLADQEAEQEEVDCLSPPSTPGFDEDAFDEVSIATPDHNRRRRQSGKTDDTGRSPALSPRSRKRAIHPSNEEVFGPQSSSPLPKTRTDAFSTPPPILTRPRKDSEAKAKTVIQALQNRGTIYSPAPDALPTPSPKKVPFDTATLRRIVPYVSSLTRKVKDTIREAEGLYYSPMSSPQHEDAPFGAILHQDAELSSQMKLMTVM